MSPKEPLQIARTDHMNGKELIVEYSDNSTAIYTVEQITALEPKAQTSSEINAEKKISNSMSTRDQ